VKRLKLLPDRQVRYLVNPCCLSSVSTVQFLLSTHFEFMVSIFSFVIPPSVICLIFQRQRAEVCAYFKRFDEAEEIFMSMVSSSLIVVVVSALFVMVINSLSVMDISSLSVMDISVLSVMDISSLSLSCT
jgi:hypothetical protein